MVRLVLHLCNHLAVRADKGDVMGVGVLLASLHGNHRLALPVLQVATDVVLVDVNDGFGRAGHQSIFFHRQGVPIKSPLFRVIYNSNRLLRDDWSFYKVIP